VAKTLYGHRGAAGEAPENTLAGFQYARQIGVRAFELDVRLSADKQLVVIHDATLERTTHTIGRVRDFTAVQLKTLDARGTCNSWPNPVGVPLLSDVLQAHRDLSAFQIEVKTDTPAALENICAQVIEQIEHFQIGPRTIVTSFDPIALAIMQKRAPRLRRGLIAPYNNPRDLDLALQLECRNVCIPLATSSGEMVRIACANGLEVTGWLGNTIADLETLVGWGVDGITSDLPSMAIPFLRQHSFLE
jgi:glycerophosphoryl diester phosphodiesterase